MSITSVATDYDKLTVTLIADFDAAIEQVWELWSDPRKLERWLGPPTHPATIETHDLAPGGEVEQDRARDAIDRGLVNPERRRRLVA